MLFTLLVYALMTLGAFAVVIAIGRRGEPNEEIADYAGLGFRYPFLGFCMTVFMLSLAGIPLACRLHRQVLPLQRRGRTGLRLAGDHRAR